MTKSAVTLDDKYTHQGGRVFLSSNQALVRLPLDQARRDRAAGLKTAGYICGYRGSREHAARVDSRGTDIAGYGPVKDASVRAYESLLNVLRGAFAAA